MARYTGAAQRWPTGNKVSRKARGDVGGGAGQVDKGGGSPMRPSDGEVEGGLRQHSGAPHRPVSSPTTRGGHGGGEAHEEAVENSSRATLTEEGRSALAPSLATASVLRRPEQMRGKGGRGEVALTLLEKEKERGRKEQAGMGWRGAEVGAGGKVRPRGGRSGGGPWPDR
jgi:hypothetical protein